jgi:hypothetical protein
MAAGGLCKAVLGLAGIACAGALYPATARADAAPDVLRGRSVVITWTERRDQINVTLNKAEIISSRGTLIVYVGSNGQVFSRMRTGNGPAASDQTAGEHDKTGFGRREVVFSANALQITNAFRGGARQFRVTARPGWSGCSATVVYARDGSGGPMRQINLKGHTQQLNAVAITGTGCRVASGNVMAD